MEHSPDRMDGRLILLGLGHENVENAAQERGQVFDDGGELGSV